MSKNHKVYKSMGVHISHFHFQAHGSVARLCLAHGSQKEFHLILSGEALGGVNITVQVSSLLYKQLVLIRLPTKMHFITKAHSSSELWNFHWQTRVLLKAQLGWQDQDEILALLTSGPKTAWPLFCTLPATLFT